MGVGGSTEERGGREYIVHHTTKHIPLRPIDPVNFTHRARRTCPSCGATTVTMGRGPRVDARCRSPWREGDCGWSPAPPAARGRRPS